ncbi:MAG: hypothetical protein CM15mV3_1380 [Caudoviricetes sp.]|nr:MAG: hypothetical protein CM15mV3_1380 [Caudoviricetes sp.]
METGNMHSGFNHDHFAIKCDRFVGPQLISYNSSQLIRERFKNTQKLTIATHDECGLIMIKQIVRTSLQL